MECIVEILMKRTFKYLGVFAFVTGLSALSFAVDPCETAVTPDKRVEVVLQILNRRHYSLNLRARQNAQNELQRDFQNILRELSFEQLRTLNHGLAASRAPFLSLRSPWMEQSAIMEWFFRICLDRRPEPISEWLDFILRKRPFNTRQNQIEVLDFSTTTEILQMIVDADRNHFRIPPKTDEDLASLIAITLEYMEDQARAEIDQRKLRGSDVWAPVENMVTLLARSVKDRPQLVLYQQFVRAVRIHREFLLTLGESQGLGNRVPEGLGPVIMDM